MILTLDVGTTSMKLCLIGRDLRIHSQAEVEYTLQTTGNLAELDPSVYLNCISSGLKQLDLSQNVDAICIVTQGETLIPVNRQGEALGNAIVWLDGRAEQEAAHLRKQIDNEHFYRVTGLPELTGSLPLCKLMWLRRNTPALYAATYRFLLLEDYLIWYFTGNFVTEKSLLTSTGYFNLETDDYWTDALSCAGIDIGKLPAALECGSIAGTLTADRASMLGLPAGIPVIAGAMDQTAAALAAGCTKPGMLCETTGTAMVAAAFTNHPIFKENHHLTVYRHVRAGEYLYLPISNTGGMSMKWIRDAFFSSLRTKKGGGYAEMDQMAASSPPGAGGLVFLPFLAGAVDPLTLPQATGCFFGVRLSSSREDFIRAVLEGVCFQLHDFLSMLDELDCHAERVCSLGGGATSPLWMQMKADICQRPFFTMQTEQAASIGAAMLACRALGLSAENTMQVHRTYSPNADNASVYQAQYTLYRQLLHALLPLYQL